MPYAYGADTTLTLSGTPFNAFVRLVKPELRAGRRRFAMTPGSLAWSGRVNGEESRPSSSATREPGGRNASSAARWCSPPGRSGRPRSCSASSSAEFPDGLGNTHGVLGRYLHDHPLAKLVLDLGGPISVRPSAYLTRPSLDRSPPLYAAACMQWGGTAALARSLLAGKPGRRVLDRVQRLRAMVPSVGSWVAPDPTWRGADGVAGLKLHLCQPREARKGLEQARDDLVGALERSERDPPVRCLDRRAPGQLGPLRWHVPHARLAALRHGE